MLNFWIFVFYDMIQSFVKYKYKYFFQPDFVTHIITSVEFSPVQHWIRTCEWSLNYFIHWLIDNICYFHQSNQINAILKEFVLSKLTFTRPYGIAIFRSAGDHSYYLQPGNLKLIYCFFCYCLLLAQGNDVTTSGYTFAMGNRCQVFWVFWN